MTDWLRLLFGTAVVLAPGWAVARALGQRGASATVVWTLAVLAGALALTFAVHGSLLLTLALVLAVGAGAVAVARPRLEWTARRLVASLGALAFGGAVWFVCGPVGGDGLFHLARVRKLDAFGDLSLRAVDEFADGGLHPGYAFPLWHGFLALVAKVSGLDPGIVMRYEPAILAALALFVAYELGCAVFGARWGGAAVLCAQVGLYVLAPGHGGGWVTLTNPGTAVRQLLAPAGVALFFTAVREPGGAALASVAAAALVSGLVHPAFTLFWLLPLVGYAAARALLARELRPQALALAAALVPFGAVLLWLRPIVAETLSHDPSRTELARALAQYRDQLAGSIDGYHLSPEVVSRGGAIAVFALVAVPFAVVAARRQWAAYVLGGTLLVLALSLVPWLFMHFADAVSLSQARRASGFLPFTVAFAGGLWALARRTGVLAPPLALLAGIGLQLAYSGDFGGKTLEAGGPPAATWVAAIGAAVALALGTVLRFTAPERRGLFAGLAAVAFVLPVAVHGFAQWSAPDRLGAGALDHGTIAALRALPAGSVVWSDPWTSYSAAAVAPVHIAVAPATHVANTRANRPYERIDAARRFARTRNLALPRRAGARWILVDRNRWKIRLSLPIEHADARYVLYRLSP
jgi:hypothetical protein